MRKNGIVYLIVICLFTMICGCGTQQAPTNPPETQRISEPETSPTVQGGIPMPAEPGNSVVEYDPDREIYIHCDNINKTCYFGDVNCYFSFEILSNKPLDPESIQIQIPSQNDYSVIAVIPVENLQDTQYNTSENTDSGELNYLPYYVYQCYRGTDFSRVAQLWKFAVNPPAEGTEEAVRMNDLTGGKDAYEVYQQLLNAEVESYIGLNSEDVREFYVYIVEVQFEGETEEIIETMDVTIGGEVYHQDLGSLHLMPGNMPMNHPWADVYIDTISVMAITTNLYGEGHGQFEAFTFTATSDVTLTDFYFTDGATELLNIELTITSAGNTMTTSWDGDSPVYLYPDDEVRIYVYVRNPYMAGLHYDTNLFYELDMVQSEETYALVNCVQVPSQWMNYHELYAIVFDGLDLESYYRDYYYPIYESWRGEYS